MRDNLLERRRKVLGSHAPLFYDKPLHLVRGEGVWLWDADGRRYLDAYNNVPHVGHSLQTRHQLIGDVRGRGLLFAVEMVRNRATREPAGEETGRAVNPMRERGVLLSRIGTHDNILKIRPPMPFGTEHADLLLETLDQALGAT